MKCETQKRARWQPTQQQRQPEAEAHNSLRELITQQLQLQSAATATTTEEPTAMRTRAATAKSAEERHGHAYKIRPVGPLAYIRLHGAGIQSYGEAFPPILVRHLIQHKGKHRNSQRYLFIVFWSF